MKSIRNCAKAIIIRDGKLLTVKYSDEGGEYYALPGGGQLHGESLPDALMRECQEELGVMLRKHSLRFIREYVGKYGESSWRDADVHQLEFIYVCELSDGEEPGSGVHKDKNQVDIVWLPIENITNYRFYPKKLIDYFGLEHLSTGELFRKEAESGSEIGLQMNEFMRQGKVIPKDLTFDYLHQELSKEKYKKGMIIDGYPKNMESYHFIFKTLKDHQLIPTALIWFNTTHQTVLRRLTGRRHCKSCNRDCHVEFLPPKVEDICDHYHMDMKIKFFSV